MPKIRNGSKGDSNPGSLDCESSILPLSYGVPPGGPSNSFIKCLANCLASRRSAVKWCSLL